MSLVNQTPFMVQDAVIPDHTGREMVVAIVKASYRLSPSGGLLRAEQQEPVRLGDVCHREDDPKSSIRYPSELCTAKVGTDVVVVGDAISPKPVTVMDIAVVVRELTVPLRVHGERVFYRGVTGVAIGPAAAFLEKPIVYEKAYGGATADGAVMEMRNPSGVGVARSQKDLVDTLAPQIEHPARPHKSGSDAFAPVGYGALWSYWSPRKDHAGTMDDAWVRDRMPIMPADFDLRANNVAHPSLVFDPPLHAGEGVLVHGMSASGQLVFTLPALGVLLTARFDGRGSVELRPTIDLVLVEPGEGKVSLVMRGAFPLGRGREKLREIRAEIEAA
ncbi:MAG: DUF2169 domain-containing protein [Minicystis sp.]